MTLKSKITIAAALAVIVIGITALFRYTQPLVRSDGLQVIYGEGETFRENAVVYTPLFTDGMAYIHLPDARQRYQWWLVDLDQPVIYSIDAPHFFISLAYAMKREVPGRRIDNTAAMGDWDWLIGQDTLSFAAGGFSCTVIVAKK